MLEELIFQLSTYIPAASHFGAMPADNLPMTTVSCGLGALILTKFTGTIGSLTIPLNYSALFIGVMISNWLLGGVEFNIDKVHAEPMIISLIGMCVAAFTMMFCMKPDGIKG